MTDQCVQFLVIVGFNLLGGFIGVSLVIGFYNFLDWWHWRKIRQSWDRNHKA
jgi:hypothetical protein